MSKSSSEARACLLEVAWEVCNQVGGIYTVIRSKVPSVMERWAGRYCLVGPYLGRSVQAELELMNDVQDVFGMAAQALRARGYDVHYAEWLVTGKPRVILLNPESVEEQLLNEEKYLLWEHAGISTLQAPPLVNRVIAFSILTRLFVEEVIAISPDQEVITHFHEWMASLPIVWLKKTQSR